MWLIRNDGTALISVGVLEGDVRLDSRSPTGSTSRSTTWSTSRSSPSTAIRRTRATRSCGGSWSSRDGEGARSAGTRRRRHHGLEPRSVERVARLVLSRRRDRRGRKSVRHAMVGRRAACGRTGNGCLAAAPRRIPRHHRPRPRADRHVRRRALRRSATHGEVRGRRLRLARRRERPHPARDPRGGGRPRSPGGSSSGRATVSRRRRTGACTSCGVRRSSTSLRRTCSRVEVSSSCVASRVASPRSQRRVAERFRPVQHSSA